MIGPAPTVDNILRAMGTFLTEVLPSDVVILQGQPNRVPEVSANRFVIMSPPRFERLETNVDTSQDCKFTGSIAGTTLTVSAVQIGVVTPGASLSSNLLVGTAVIVSQLSGTPGGAGTYRLSTTQTVTSSTISAGQKAAQMASKATVQLDFHASDGTSGDLANIVSTLMRDPFAVDQFANQSPNYGVVPLYADDARQLPFHNDQQQVEWRWVVEALLQANIVVSIPAQFADSVALDLVSVDAVYP